MPVVEQERWCGSGIRIVNRLKRPYIPKSPDQSAESVIEWFDRDNLPSEPDDVMRLVIKERQIMVGKWLLEKLPWHEWDKENHKLALEQLDIVLISLMS
ncbi:hypothetical protein HK105_204745 [Polyrhizophydium stewartii]|uniref:Uncharacterized protein n=1 Tax=Polyrhizophydium stewartii TaxID=2732419 RepID=A0ABR4N8E8_9FUNG